MAFDIFDTDNEAIVRSANSASTEAAETDLDFFFVGGNGGVSATDTVQEMSGNGEKIPVVFKEPTELTESEVTSLCPVLAKMYHALNNMDPTADELKSFLRRLNPGIRDKDADRFAETFAKMDAKRRQDQFEDLWTWDEDTAEEGALPDGYEDGNRKAVLALQTKALNNFLALTMLVNPATGRNFQGFMEDLRGTLRRSLGFEPDSEALSFVDGLVNPRANPAATPSLRYAYFAETLASFSTNPERIMRCMHELLGPKNGHPKNRKALVLLGYLAAMPTNVRSQMTQLVASSAPSKPVKVRASFLREDGHDAYGKLADKVVFTVERRRPNSGKLSVPIAAATYRELTGKTATEVRALAAALTADAKAASEADGFLPSLKTVRRGNAPSLFNSMANLFEKYFGADSTICSIFSSYDTGDYIDQGILKDQLRDVLVAPKGAVPYAVEAIVSGLETIAGTIGDGKVTAEVADQVAALVFATGNSANGGYVAPPNSARRPDQLSAIFSAFQEVMPATIVTAEVDPERTNQPASSVAITMRGVEPVLQVFMDRMDAKGFRAVCERLYPAFAGLPETGAVSKQSVLGLCRQTMCWPTAARDSIVAKSLSKSMDPLETYKGCETSFELANDMAALAKISDPTARGAKSNELKRKYGVTTIAAFRPDNTFYVPVFSGDHSSSILISCPFLDKFAGKTYLEAATEVASWLGLDLLGEDAKRSATTSLEAPGVSFIGLKHNPDGTVKYARDSRFTKTGTWTLDNSDEPRGARARIANWQEYRRKDQAKFNYFGGITKYIGFGPEGSSTKHYADTTFKDIAVDGTGSRYTSDDVVGVSISGASRSGSVPLTDPRYQTELALAMQAGATIVADNKKNRERPYNKDSEGRLAEFLSANGYVATELADGAIWRPADKASAESEPEHGECRVNIVWSKDGGANESMLGTTLATGYGIEQLKLCAKDVNSTTLKFHAMNTANSGSYGAHLEFIKSLCTGMKQESNVGEFGKWDPKRVLMDFIRKQRSSDYADSTSVLTDFDSIKLSLANSKTMGVSDGNGGVKPFMKWFFDELGKAIDRTGRPLDSYEGDALDKLFATEDNPEGLVDWVDQAMPERSGKRKISEILDGVRLDRIEGLASENTYSLSYVNNDLMGFQVANVSHTATTQKRGKTQYGKTPRNNLVDAMTMASVLRTWNADIANSDRDGNNPGVFSNLGEVVDNLQELLASWVDVAKCMVNDPYTAKMLRLDDEEMREMQARNEPIDGQFMRDKVTRALASLVRKNINVPLKAIDTPLVSNMSWVDDNDNVQTHSASQMFKDTLQGSMTILRDDNRFMRAYRRMALCNVNNRDPSFRYGLYLGVSCNELEAKFANVLQNWQLTESEPTKRTIEILDVVFTELRDAEEAVVKTSDRGAADRALFIRRSLAECFFDHRGKPMVEHKRHYKMRSNGQIVENVAEWYVEVSYDDLFTNLVKDERGKPTFDRSAVYTDMTDSKGVKRMYLGGTMFGLPRTPSGNGSMWLQVVRAALPVTEKELDDGDWKAGYDAMVAPDPFTLKILGCDHDGDKSKLYMLESPSVMASANSKAERTLRDAPRTLNLNAGAASWVERRKEYVGKDDEGYSLFDLHELQVTDVAKMQANNSFVMGLFDMARALPVECFNFSAPVYCGMVTDREGFDNLGAAFRGTKATLTPKAEEGAEPGTAWDTDITKNADIVLPAVLDAKSGRTIGNPEIAAIAGSGMMNAGNARALVVSLASSLHLSWMSGVCKTGLFSGMSNKRAAAEWLDFIYHIDGLSKMTFEDAKEQMCSRLGITFGMMDTIIADFIAYGRAHEAFPTSDKEFADAFKEYAKSGRAGESRAYMRRATDKTDYAMQADIRRMFTGNATVAVTFDALKSFFGLKYDTDGKKWVADPDNQSGTGCFIVNELRAELPKFCETYHVAPDVAEEMFSDLLRRLATMNVNYSDVAGYVKYLVDKKASGGDTSLDCRTMLEWFVSKRDLAEAKAFAKSINYLKADPTAPGAATQAEKLRNSFDKLIENCEDKALAKRLDRMHSGVLQIYNALAASTVQGFGEQAIEKYEKNVSALARNGSDPLLAALFIGAERLDKKDPLVVQANAQMVGMSLAAFRTVRVLPNSKINSGNILDVLEAIGTGSANATRGKRPRNLILDACHGIETLFDLMYRLNMSSTARNVNPIFTYFSERGSSGARGFDEGTYYGTPEGAPPVTIKGHDGKLVTLDVDARRIGLLFLGVSESQMDDVRKLYDRVVDGRELDDLPFQHVLYSKQKEEHGFGISVNSIKQIAASKSLALAVRTRSRFAQEMRAELAEAAHIIHILKGVLGEDVNITPSIMFGQLLPIYAALTQRLDRTPDSRSSNIVTALGDTYQRWANELVSLKRRHPELLSMATAVNHAPVMLGWEMDEMGEAKPRRMTQDEIVRTLRQQAARLNLANVSELLKLAVRSDSKGNLFKSKAGRILVKTLHLGEWSMGSPSHRAMIDPFGNQGLYKALLKHFADADRRERRPAPRSWHNVPNVNPYAEELATRMGTLLKYWVGATVEYRGGDEFFIRGTLCGTTAERQNPNGRDTLIRVKLVERVYSDTELARLVGVGTYANNGPDTAWLLSNANSRSDVIGRKITVEQVKAELARMDDAHKMQYIRMWSPVAVSHKNPQGDWTVDATAAGTLCREIVISRDGYIDGRFPNVIYHEYFHTMVNLLNAVGRLSKENLAYLQNKYGKNGRWFNEEEAAEDYRRFVETGECKDKWEKNIFLAVNAPVNVLPHQQNALKI